MRFFLHPRAKPGNLNSNIGIKIVTIGRFDESFNGFWDKVSEHYPAIVKRGTKALRWRFDEQPYQKYTILAAKSGDAIIGYVAVREGKVLTGRLDGLKTGVISDILFDPKDMNTGRLLLSAAVSFFGNKVDIIRCDILDKKMGSIISAAGFMEIRSNNRFLIYPITVPPVKRNWHLTYSDSDLDLF